MFSLIGQLVKEFVAERFPSCVFILLCEVEGKIPECVLVDSKTAVTEGWKGLVVMFFYANKGNAVGGVCGLKEEWLCFWTPLLLRNSMSTDLFQEAPIVKELNGPAVKHILVLIFSIAKWVNRTNYSHGINT